LIWGFISFIILIFIVSLFISSLKNYTKTEKWLIFGGAVLAGIIAGILMSWFYQIGIGLATAGGGAILFMIFYDTFLQDTPIFILYIGMGLTAIILFIIGFWISNYILIIITSLVGSYMIARGSSVFIGGFPN